MTAISPTAISHYFAMQSKEFKVYCKSNVNKITLQVLELFFQFGFP